MYDSQNQLIEETTPSGVTLSYTYDAIGNRTMNTAVGRAFQKHSNRPGSAFIGELSGNGVKNTQQGLAYLKSFIDNPNARWVTRNTKAFGEVLEIRLPNGQGARWSADGSKFIGFLEPNGP